MKKYTITLNSEPYQSIKKFCDDNNLKIGKFTETVLLNHIQEEYLKTGVEKYLNNPDNQPDILVKFKKIKKDISLSEAIDCQRICMLNDVNDWNRLVGKRLNVENVNL